MLVPSSAVLPDSPLGALVDECRRWGSPAPGERMKICPRLPASLAANATFLGAVPPEPETPERLAAQLMPALEAFGRLRAHLGSAGHLASIVVWVPCADAEHGSSVVEAAHRMIKSAALRSRMIPGEFGRCLHGGGTRFPEVATRQSLVGEYIAVRELLAVDGKYMTEPAWQAIHSDLFPAIEVTAS
jgi:hypothetical protein